jgi:formylglycine-generating enzyme required for sulfatase activity
VCGLSSACGRAPDSQSKVLFWAKVAPEQIAEAKKHGVPVAFENDLGMRFVLIQAGTFLMGSPEDEVGRDEGVPYMPFSNEPQRPSRDRQSKVTLTTSYYMQTTEVTNEQFRHWRASHSSGEYEGKSLDADRQPVVNILLSDAVGFAQWLSDRDVEFSYRLPDEIEWECACRAGTQGTFCWSGGVEVGHQYANISDTTSYLGVLGVKEIWPRDDGHGVAAPVGSYLPNTYGLYDMIGNVSEFTTGTNKTNPDGSLLPPNPQYMRVPITRGGSWLLGVQQARCAARNPAGAVVVLGFPDHGFRLVADLEPIEGDR